MKHTQIITGSGIVNANCLAEFSHAIGDKEYTFQITQKIDELIKTITHRESGYKVCNLGVTHELKLYRAAHNDVERAKVALNELISKYGASRITVVIDCAPLLPKYKAQQLNAERVALVKPTMEQKYEALPVKGKAIVDAVVAAHTRAGTPAMVAEWEKQCAEGKVTLGESCALSDIIRHKLKGQISTGIHQE